MNGDKSYSVLPEGVFCFTTAGAAPVLDLQVSLIVSLVAMASATVSRIVSSPRVIRRRMVGNTLIADVR